jgi:hypothetical protein
MFKIICDNKIIDVVKSLKYVRYIKETKKIIPCDKVVATGIYSYNHKKYYSLQGVTLPEEIQNWPRVFIAQIQESEYNDLKEKLYLNKIVYANNRELGVVRNTKIEELNQACKDAILKGIEVYFADGSYHTFKLTLEDQINLLELEKEILAGAKYVLYHGTNEVCELYSAEDMKKVIDMAGAHKKYHTTYFNLLKYCIYNMYNIEEIERVKYGINFQELPISDEMKNSLRIKLYG